jgi:hypothetical protein
MAGMTPERRAELRREVAYRFGTFWQDMRDLLDAIDALLDALDACEQKPRPRCRAKSPEVTTAVSQRREAWGEPTPNDRDGSGEPALRPRDPVAGRRGPLALPDVRGTSPRRRVAR